MAESVAMPVADNKTAADADAAARSARVSALIGAILASPNVAAIKAALADGDVAAAAATDNGVAGLVGILSGAGAVAEAKELQALQPSADEMKQIKEGVNPPAQGAALAVGDANAKVAASGGAVETTSGPEKTPTVVAAGTAADGQGNLGAGSAVVTDKTAALTETTVSPQQGIVASAALSTANEGPPDSKAKELLDRLGIKQNEEGRGLGVATTASASAK